MLFHAYLWERGFDCADVKSLGWHGVMATRVSGDSGGCYDQLLVDVVVANDGREHRVAPFRRPA